MLIVKEDIISRINNGDAKAFEQLYTTFYVYLCAVATKYVYNSEAAREIVNDVFMNVWNHHSALIHPVNAYLIRSVRNYCLNYLRDKRQQEVPLSDVQENLLSFGTPIPSLYMIERNCIATILPLSADILNQRRASA